MSKLKKYKPWHPTLERLRECRETLNKARIMLEGSDLEQYTTTIAMLVEVMDKKMKIRFADLNYRLKYGKVKWHFPHKRKLSKKLFTNGWQEIAEK